MTKGILEESIVTVLTGTAVNYPLSLFFLWFLIDKLEMQSVFWIATCSTLAMTIAAFIRVYWIRSYYERRNSTK